MSNTRSSPKRSCSPGVTSNTPPAAATSSPKKMTAVVALHLLGERVADRGAELERRSSGRTPCAASGRIRVRRGQGGLDARRRAALAALALDRLRLGPRRRPPRARRARATRAGRAPASRSTSSVGRYVRRIGLRVADVAVGLALEQRRPAARARAFDRLARRPRRTAQHVVAVDDARRASRRRAARAAMSAPAGDLLPSA